MLYAGIHENHRHLYPCEEPIVARAEDFRRDVNSAQGEKKISNGVKGRCFFDTVIQIPNDVPIDAMYQVFLGCAKSSITALFGSLTKRDVLTAEERIQNIKSPRNLQGKPKPLSKLLFWKARDFKFFLFHYGSFCLQGLVKQEYHL